MSDPNETRTTANESGQSPGDQTVQGSTLDPKGAKKKSIADRHPAAARPQGGRADFDELPDDELEEERQKRLDPDNRPDNIEVDNSNRTFDPKTGFFEDTDMEPPEDAPYSTTEAEESNAQKEPEDREESTDAEQSKDTEG